MNRSSSRIKQPKKSINSHSRNNSRQTLEKSKTQTRNNKIDKQEKLIVNAKKGVNVGKRTGQQIKKKETGLNYDGTEKLSDYFAQQDGLSIDSDQNEILSDNFEKHNGDLKVSSISDLQDDSQIVQLFNKKDSLDFNLSPEQSLYDRKSIESKQQSKKLAHLQNKNEGEINTLFETNKKNLNKPDRRKESSLGLKSFTSNLLEIPSTNNRKTSSFRLQRSQNSKYRNSIALSSIPKISRFSGRMNDNVSDVSSDRLDDFELLGQLSNLPPEIVAKSIQQGTSLDNTPFTKNIEDFEITLSESEISQQHSHQQFNDDRRRKSDIQSYQKKNFNEQKFGQDEEEQEEGEEEEIQQLLKQNKQIISQISQRKKMNNSNSFNSYLLDISESKIYYKSDKKNNNIQDFGKISPIQEINTQQSNKNEDSFRKYRDEMVNKSLDNFMEIVNPNKLNKENQNQKQQILSKFEKAEDEQYENDKLTLPKNIPNKQQLNQQSLKLLKQNQMIEEQEEINQNQIFQYKKNQRNYKKKQSQESMDMSVENKVDVQIQARDKQQMIKQLKKNRNSLDSSYISLQIKEQIDSINQSNFIESNEEIQKKLLVDQYIKQKRGSTDFQFQNQQENHQKRNSGFNKQKCSLNQQEINIDQKDNTPKQLEKNEVNQNIQNSKLQNFNLEQKLQNEEKNIKNQNENNLNYKDNNKNQNEKIQEIEENCLVLQVNNQNIYVDKKLSIPPTLKIDSDQKQNNEYDLNSHSYNIDNDQNMEVMQNQSYLEEQEINLQRAEYEISIEQNKQLSNNKKMDVENEGVADSDQINLSVENKIPRKAGRPKRKKITPKKFRKNSQSVSESEIQTETSNDSIQGKQNKKKQKKQSQNNSQVSSISSNAASSSKQLKKIIWKKSQKNNSQQLLQQYEDFYAKGFQNKIEVEIKAEASSFGKDGRYPVRNRIRPLVSWRERAVYGKEGLLYIITDQSLEKLDYVNYTVPGFSDVPEPRLHKKNNKKAINKNTSQSYKSLDQIKEEADDTEIFKNAESQKQDKNEKESAGTYKLSNRNSNQSSDKRIKSKIQQTKSPQRDEKDEIPSQKKEQKNRNIKNKQKDLTEKSKSQSPFKAQLASERDQKNKNFKEKINKSRQRSSDYSEDIYDPKLQKQDQNNKLQTQKKEKPIQEKINKKDQSDLDFIQNLLNLDKISKFDIKISESSNNILKFNLVLNPGSEIQCQKSKHTIEVKVIECAWKKLLICIEEATNYLKQDDKKLIKKDQYFSLKYKEKENSKNCQLLITIFKNSQNSKSSKS
ncbi:hypothetical protein ABPG74_013501 [Tetrahymena malaccensis]